jgi:hypothetical protein
MKERAMIAVAVALVVATADVDRLEVGPLRVEISYAGKEVGRDDPLRIDVTVQSPPKIAVEPPAIKAGEMLDSALVTQVRVDGPDAVDGPFGKVTLQNWSLVLEPTKVGTLNLGKLRIRYQEQGKPAVAAEIQLPSFEVKPGRVSVGPDEPLIPPPPLPVAAHDREAVWWMKAVGGGLLAVCLLALAFNAFMPKSLVANGRSAILAAGGTPRQAISQICDAVRAQLQKEHGVTAATLTTPELLADEELLAPLPSETRAALAELLPLADMLRFPQPEPTVADLDRCRQVALRVVGAKRV